MRITKYKNASAIDYAVKLAMNYKYNEATESQTRDHFTNEIESFYNIYEGRNRIGIAYISRRTFGNLTFYTLDGYAGEGANYTHSIRAGRHAVEQFRLKHKEDLFSAAFKRDAGIMILLKKLGFKPVKLYDKYIIYRNDKMER